MTGPASPLSGPLRTGPGPEPLAIVGIGCRFPGGADSPEKFWTLLEHGVDAITEVPADRWLLSSFFDPDPRHDGKIYTRWGGFVDRVDEFEPLFFGISPREAEVMDPQQRLLLEVAWEALEDAGLVASGLAGSATGVFVGISSHDFGDLIAGATERTNRSAYKDLGTALSIAANRISYVFDFRGPSMAVDTACSSSLVALHLACESLWKREATIALVGGVNAILRPETSIGFCNAGMLSPTGRCRSFDAGADGFVRAEGAGMIVLKPLACARRDRDRVYATILATAINQDGHTNGIAVPNGAAQQALLRAACARAGLRPAAIQYVEAHGTGTPVGDPIEANALGAVLGAGRAVGESCRIGSVKTNIGHLEAAAGIAGVIKVALALNHRLIPGTLHFQKPNPQIDFAGLHIQLAQRLEEWPPQVPLPRLAGVNAFGFGGANAHAILSEAPADDDGVTDKGGRALSPCHLVALSAQSPEALEALARRWRDWLANGGREIPIEDIAYSAGARRTHHAHRLAAVADGPAQLSEQLEAFLKGEARPGLAAGRATASSPPVVFVFTGLGPQWWGMGQQLLREEPVFRDALEQCSQLWEEWAGWSLVDELWAPESASRLNHGTVGQPAVFGMQVALTALWRSWGIEPAAVVGHSLGEVAAAYVSGVLSLPDAIRVLYHRGRLENQAHGLGKMLAVALPPAQVEELLACHAQTVVVAAVNSPSSVTLSGALDALEAIHRGLEDRGTFARFLSGEVPYHGPHMDHVRDELLACLAGLSPAPPSRPLVSTVTGRFVEGPMLDAGYWWRNVREPVAFDRAVQTLLEAGHTLFLEIGPHPALAGSIRECAVQATKAVTVLPSLRRRSAERATLLETLGQLYVLGHTPEWERLVPGGRVVSLPTYPWQRQRYWGESEQGRQIRIGLAEPTGGAILGPAVHPLLGRRVESAHSQTAWHTDLDVQHEHAWLADHQVQGAVVVPAAAYLEMALAAGKQCSATNGLILEEVHFRRPLILKPGERRAVQVLAGEGGHALEICAREADGSWARNATAKVRRVEPTPGLPPTDLAEARGRCPREMPGPAWYQQCREVGLEYGLAFQGVEQVWCGRGEALGRIRVPAAVADELGHFHIHPSVLDAAFQVVCGVVADLAGGAAPGLYLPHRIGRLRLVCDVGDTTGPWWSHVRLLAHTEQSVTAQLRLLAESGAVLADIEDFSLQRMAGHPTTLSTDDLLYQYRWQEPPLAEPARARAPAAGGWLLFADRGGLAERLAVRLNEMGSRPVLVRPGDGFRIDGADVFRVRPESADDFTRLMEEVRALPVSCRGIVHLWALDTPAAEDMALADLDAAQTLGCISAALLVQATQAWTWTEPPRLWLVTRHTQAVNGFLSLAVAQAPLWGVGRVIANEHPELCCTRIDLGPDPSDAEIESLAAELASTDGEDEVALRGSSRYVHRLLPVSLGELRSAPAGPDRDHPAVRGCFQLTIGRPGALDSLALRSAAHRRPGPGEVEIEVRAAGLNFKDVAKAIGLLGDASLSGTYSGRQLGLECAGIVTAVGDGVTSIQPGDAVLALGADTFRSHVITRAGFVVPKPDRLSFEEAAALPVAFLTAHYALRQLAQLEAGERVLIHSASGGVGLAAVQIAQAAGAEVYATAGNPEKRAFLQMLGVRHVFDSRSLEFADAIRECTRDEGLDVVLNSLTGEAIPRSLALLRTGGRFLEIGKRDIEQDQRLDLRPFQASLAYFAIDLDRLWAARPDAMSRLLRKLVHQVEADELQPLPVQAFPMSRAAEAFQHLARARHIGKVVLSVPEGGMEVLDVPGAAPGLRADGTYLITGGLGGFGLATARWLAAGGAGHLVLAGRSGATNPEAEHAVNDLRMQGVQVTVARTDVTCPEQLAELLAEVRRTAPPLRGVFHAAMVLDDAPLRDLTPDRFRAVLAPKIAGAWNLHCLTQNDPLAQFVLFSSVAATFGNPGQANYAAGNLFLDMLAHHRRARGQPALAVNWTAVADVGALAQRPQLRRHLEALGLTAVPAAKLLPILADLLRHDAVQAAVLLLNGPRWAPHMPAAQLPRFTGVVQQHGAVADGEISLREAIRAATGDTQIRLVEDCVREQLSKVLGVAPTQMERDQSLQRLGLDSLTAVEVGTRLHGALGVSVQTMRLVDGATVGGLVMQLLEQITTVPASPEHSV
jgi:polyketide synthase 12/epothilone polyketide synthase D